MHKAWYVKRSPWPTTWPPWSSPGWNKQWHATSWRLDQTILVIPSNLVFYDSLQLIRKGLNEPWGCIQYKGWTWPKHNPLGQPFPLQVPLKVLCQGKCCCWQQGCRGKDRGRLVGQVTQSLCSQQAAKKGARKLVCANQIYWYHSSASWTVIHQKQHWNWHSS